MSKYIKFGGTVFNIHKILWVKARNSKSWWRFPYILELCYGKRWTETTPGILINLDKISLPVGGGTTRHNTTDHQYKYENRKSIETDLNMFRENGSSLNLLRCRRQRSKGGRYPPVDTYNDINY